MPGKNIKVPGGLHLQARFFSATSGAWRKLGNLESTVVRDDFADIHIEQPVYVASLARSGTTILTEMLAQHDEVTSHRYSDFPNVWTPYWRNFLLQKTRKEAPEPEERAHQDRIMVSQDSPEAVEEVLWMHFFPQCHESGHDNTLGADISNDDFETFYREHIRKLLAVRGARRYLAKGNYNVLRLPYLSKLFPDLKIVVPYRDPVDHIASLMKQHQFFLEQHRQDPRVGRHLSLSGHFEFGPHRKAVNFGHRDTWNDIELAWNEGREVEGWARYWAATFNHLLAQTEQHQQLAAACMFVSYEQLCDDSENVIDDLLNHCELDPEPFESSKSHYSQHLSRPAYYQPDFSVEERELISRVCQPTMEALGRRNACD